MNAFVIKNTSTNTFMGTCTWHGVMGSDAVTNVLMAKLFESEAKANSTLKAINTNLAKRIAEVGSYAELHKQWRRSNPEQSTLVVVEVEGIVHESQTYVMDLIKDQRYNGR